MDRAGLNNTAALLPVGSTQSFICDVGEAHAVEKLVQAVQQWSGVPNVVVNGAGIVRDSFMLKMEEQQFDEVVRVNLKVLVCGLSEEYRR